MLTIDDAAILKRAKELCDQSGLAWNLLSRTSRDMRVLTDRDRRECLMRARDELIRAGEEEDVPQDPAPTARETTVARTRDKAEQLASPLDEFVTAAPARRVA